MSDTHEWTEEQVAAALADLLDQPRPTTTNPALQPHLNIFQELQALVVQPSVRFEKELSRLLLGHKQKAEKVRGREPLLLRLRSYFPFRWPPSPRLAASLMILAIFLAWTFWPIRVAIPYDSPGERAMPPQVRELLEKGLPTTRFELLSTYGFTAYTTTSLPDDLEYQFQPNGSGSVDVVGARPVPLFDTLNLLPVVEQPVETGITLAAAPQNQERLVQQNAQLNIVVVDIPATVDQIVYLAQESEGYIESLNIDETPAGNPRASMRLRVSASQLMNLITQIKSLSTEVTTESIYSQDVTTEYIDLNARLRNLQLAETEISDLLMGAEERGETSEDILRIYNHLSEIRGQIEQLQGQIQHLEQTVALSLITVGITTKPGVEEFQPGPFSVSQTANEAWFNFVSILQKIMVAIIWLGIHSPLILLPLGLVWLIRRRNTTHRLQSKQ
jgi:hypothetical protein